MSDIFKKLIVYPTYGYRDTTGDWKIPMRAWVRNQLPDKVVQGAIKTLQSSRLTVLQERVLPFLAKDNKGEVVRLSFGPSSAKIDREIPGKTDDNGIVNGAVTLTDAEIRKAVTQEGGAQVLSYSAFTKGLSGSAKAEGKIRLISERGLSIVSDIDDTVKVTEILEGKKTVLKRTFLMKFEATKGMQSLYANILREHQDFDNAAFHYVSGSPWQLGETLEPFLFNEARFPAGSFHLRELHSNSSDVRETLEHAATLIVDRDATKRFKLEAISSLLKRFPQRRFVMYGDSGERDPEVYQELRDKAKDQILAILIRDVASLGSGHSLLTGMWRIDMDGTAHPPAQAAPVQ
jgi:phosphatidate phosphatase APP1